jgi:hypothetical protein
LFFGGEFGFGNTGADVFGEIGGCGKVLDLEDRRVQMRAGCLMKVE